MLEIKDHGNNIISSGVFDDDGINIVLDFVTENDHGFENISHSYGQNTTTKRLYLPLFKDSKNYNIVDKTIYDAVLKLITAVSTKIPDFGKHYPLDDDSYAIRRVIGETRLHVDGPCPIQVNNQTMSFRVGTVILNMEGSNDVLEFPTLNTSIKMDKGTAIFFPPYWTHPHRVTYAGKISHRIQTWIITKVAYDKEIKKPF